MDTVSNETAARIIALFDEWLGSTRGHEASVDSSSGARPTPLPDQIPDHQSVDGQISVHTSISHPIPGPVVARSAIGGEQRTVSRVADIGAPHRLEAGQGEEHPVEAFHRWLTEQRPGAYFGLILPRGDRLAQIHSVLQRGGGRPR